MATTVGARIRLARRSADLTQHALAMQLGADAQKISKWERGEHLPNSASLVALSELFGYPVAWFYCERDEIAA